MSQHTPGPWHWHVAKTLRWLTAVGGRAIRVFSPAKNNKSYPMPTEEDEANLALLAAAPELYEACRYCLDMLRQVFPTLDLKGEETMARKLAAVGGGRAEKLLADALQKCEVV